MTWRCGTLDVTPPLYGCPMDDIERDDRGPGAAVAAGGPDAPGPHEPEQARLPFEQVPVMPLPFDNEADRPIGFALTARARRTVAPTALPELSVVTGADEQDPADTRPARARALRRAGADLADIARQLMVDELLVRAWADDVAAPSSTRRGSAAVRAAAVLAAPAGPSGSDQEPDAADHRSGVVRRDAVADGRRRLAQEADFAVGVGLMAGLVTIDRHAIGFQTDRPELAARACAWLTAHAGADPRDVRVVLRLGKAVAGDVARHRWASALGIDTAQIAFTRWRHAADDGAVEALVRIADADVAARVAGWCEALLRPEADPADVAF